MESINKERVRRLGWSLLHEGNKMGIDDPLAGFQFKIDPDFVSMATSNKQVYDAHIEAGFTPDQAMLIITGMLNTSIQTNLVIESERTSEAD